MSPPLPETGSDLPKSGATNRRSHHLWIRSSKCLESSAIYELEIVDKAAMILADKTFCKSIRATVEIKLLNTAEDFDNGGNLTSAASTAEMAPISR